jgi:hypothetical protein
LLAKDQLEVIVDDALPCDHATLEFPAWADALVEAHGYPACSNYVETFWLPILGPSATLAYRRLGAIATGRPDGTQIALVDLARDLGLGTGVRRNSPMVRTLRRLVTYGMARWERDALAVRTVAPPLNARHLMRLTAGLRRAHDRQARSASATRPA